MAADLSYEAYLATKKKKPTGSLLYSSTAAAPTFTNTYKAAPVPMPAAKTTSSQKDLSYSAYLSSKTPEKPNPLYSSTASAPNFNNTLKLQTQSKIPANQSTPQGQRYVAPPEVIKKALYPEVKPKPNIREQLTKPLLNVLKSFGQETAKGFMSSGAAIAGVPKQVKNLAQGKPAPIGSYTPVEKWEKAIFGTDKKISLQTQGESFGVKNPALATGIGLGLSLADLSGTGAVSKRLNLKGIKAILHATDVKYLDDVVRTFKAGDVIPERHIVLIRNMLTDAHPNLMLPPTKKGLLQFVDDALKSADDVAEQSAFLKQVPDLSAPATRASLDSPAAIASANAARYNAARAKKPPESFLERLRDAVTGQFQGSRASPGHIKNPFADKAAGTINRHITSAKQIIQELGDDGIKRGGGMDALLKRTQTNIVDALRHEGDDVMADAVAKLKPASFDDFLTVKRGVSVPKTDMSGGFEGETLYHAGAKIDEVKLNKSNFDKTFYMSENADYAKSFGGNKGVLNEMKIDPKAKLADLRKPTPDQIDELRAAIAKETAKNVPYGDKNFSFYPYTEKQVLQGIADGKAHFAELPQIKQILRKLGYDGQITAEVPYAKNVGVWNKDMVRTASPSIPKGYSPGIIKNPFFKGAGEAAEEGSPALPKVVRQGESYINTPSGLGQSVQKSLEAPKTVFGSQSLPKPSIERGLVTSAKGATNLSPEIKAMVEGQYVPRSSAELMERAQNLVKDFPEIAERMARSTKTDDVTVAVSSQLIRRLSEMGEHERAIDIIERLAPKATESGRATQILAYFDKLTPEGVGRFAQRQVDIANEMFPKANLSLTPKQYASFYDKAAEIGKMADGYDKQFATAQLLKSIHDIFPASVASKLSTFQTMAQLLNPKTLIRNLVGNTLFSGLENVKSAVATPIDKFLSLFTGQRTAGLPSLATQGKGFAKGLGQGFKEAKAGVTVGPLSQFDLPQVQVFKGKVLGSLEKSLGMALRAPDKAAYTAAFDDSLRMLMKTNGVKEATPEMLQKAHYDGLYRTFQDDNLISNFFVQTKGLLNNIGIKGGEGKTFGLGDLILKYPKTPGALIARGIDYSPAGFINTVFQAAKPLFGKPFDQKTFVDSFSRALIGSAGLVGTGAIMAKLGIITGSPSDDPDVRAIQKQTGQGSYQINASSLKRFVMSGFNAEAARKREGDTLISYDWAQPIAAPLSLGAKLAEGKAEGTMTAITEAIVGGVDTLQEQPLVTGLKTLFGYGDIKQGLISNAQSLPASFVPTAIKQINQTFDNTQRETYDPNPLKKAVNLAKSKIPGLAQTLPAAIDISGKEREVYQEGSNSLFNVFLNPAFVTQIKTSPDAKMVLDIVEQAGLTAQIPRVVGKKQTVNGESMELTTQQYIELQQFVGKATREVFLQLAETPDFLKLSDEEKVKRLTSALTDIGKLGKVQVLGDSGDFKTLEDIKGKLKMRSTYDQIQELGKQGDQQKIDSILNAMSDEEYELYVKARTTARSQNTSTLRGFLERKSPEAVVFLRSLAPKEKERLLENMTDEEYAIYRELKNKI